MSELTVGLSLDKSKLKQGLDGAGADAENFKKKFESSMRETRGAVKDVAGSIEGIGRAFDGSVQGMVSGFRDLAQLIPISPWAAMGAAAAGAFTAIAKYAENAENKIAEQLDKSIVKWKKFRDEAKRLDNEIAGLKREAQKPESGTTEAVDFAGKEKAAAEEAYKAAQKANAESAKRIEMMRAAKPVFDEYAKAYGKEAAADILNPTRTTPTGQSVSSQRASLQSRGILFDASIIESLRSGQYNKEEENAEESIRNLKAAEKEKLEAEQRYTQELKKYQDARTKDAKDGDAQRKRDAEQAQRELDARVMAVMAEGHNEFVEKRRKQIQEESRIRRATLKVEDDLAEKEMEARARANEDIADVYKKREGKADFSSGIDMYQRMGGRVGANLDVGRLSRQTEQEKIQAEIKDINKKMEEHLLKIRQNADDQVKQLKQQQEESPF